MEVRLTRNVLIGQEVRRAGATVSVGDDLAKELVESKLAEAAEEKKQVKPKKSRAKS